MKPNEVVEKVSTLIFVQVETQKCTYVYTSLHHTVIQQIRKATAKNLHIVGIYLNFGEYNNIVLGRLLYNVCL